MAKPPVRLVTCAWGKEHLDKLLTFPLGSVLAPGNLPRLTAQFDCSVVIVTETRFFDYVRQHAIIRRIESICPLCLLPLDDIVGESWQYGISLAYALFRGFRELGPAMTDTYLLFLNADFILANGSYERLIPHMLRNERVLLAPSYCTVAERVAPLLAARCDPRTGILALPPRELAAITLSHRHNTVRAKTINQRLVHFEYMDQSYWDVDPDTLLGHQMPISLVAMRPEVALSDLSSFWDWGIAYDFCPSQRLTVFGDSDDFLMLELREEAAHLNLVRVGPMTAKAAASRMLGYITQYQIDAGRFPLTLHSRDLLPGAASAHAALQRFVDELSRYLSRKPKDHRNHPDWLYHKERLQRYHEEKAKKTRATARSRNPAARNRRQPPTGLRDPIVDLARRPLLEAKEEGVRQLENQRDAEREAVVARIRELENQRDAEQKAVVARIRELENQRDAEREAAVARIRELGNQLDAEQKAAVARIRELGNQLDAEREAAVARIRELENQRDAEREAAVAGIRELGNQLDAEREAAVAQIRELGNQRDAERKAAVARIRELGNQVDAISQAASVQVIELRTRADAERSAAMDRIRELEMMIESERNAVLSSTSWRITGPLRWLSHQGSKGRVLLAFWQHYFVAREKFRSH
jgi:hypothetical protein